MNIFNRKKYLLFILILFLMAVGYVLMSGPESVESSFNEAMFSFRRITLAPIVILSAYGMLIFLIFKKR